LGKYYLIHEAIPRCISAADIHLHVTTGMGILRTYTTSRIQKYDFQIYNGALSRYSGRSIHLETYDFLGNVQLRTFVTNVVRHSENVLRDIYGERGRRLSVENMDPLLKTRLEGFLHKHYDRKQDINETGTISFDPNIINELRVESDRVREMLRVENAEVDEPDYSQQLVPVTENELQSISDSTANILPVAEETQEVNLDISSLPEDLKELLTSYSNNQRRILKAISIGEDAQTVLERVAEEEFSVPEVLIDEINSAAISTIGCELIDTDDFSIIEEYAELIKSALTGGLS